MSLTLVGAAAMLYYHLGLFMPRVLAVRAAKGLGNGYAFGDDFYPVWLTTQQSRAGHRDLYSPEMTRAIQTGLFGRPLNASHPNDPPPNYREFAYPAFADLIFWPAAASDFPTVRIVLAVLLPVLTAVSLWLWLQALQWQVHPLWFVALVVLTLTSYQALEAFFADQPGLVVGFLLAASALTLRRGRLLAAGALMALTLLKPQMTLLAVLYLLLWSLSDRRRLRFCAGFVTMTAALMATSLFVWRHWVAGWLGVLFGYHRYATPALAILLPGAVLGGYLGPVATVALLAAALVLAWKHRRAQPDSSEFWLTLGLLLAITSITLLPGQAVYDDVILLPGILLVVQRRHELRNGGLVPRTLLAVGAIVLVWPLASALALVLARPWLPAALFESTAVFSLPIRTAASLPFAALALLACAARFIFGGAREPS